MRSAATASAAVLALATLVAAQKGGPQNAGVYLSSLQCGLDPKVNALSALSCAPADEPPPILVRLTPCWPLCAAGSHREGQRLELAELPQ